jgi:hypothetical protein
MKSSFLISSLSLLLCSSMAIAQDIKVLFDKDTTHVSSYKPIPAPELPGRKQLLIETGFNNSSFINFVIPGSLKEKVIEKIELVYTQYWTGSKFSQRSLNDQRLETLKRSAPFLLKEPLTEWRLVAQHPSNTEQAKSCFHGFVITYRETPTTESMKDELSYINRILGDKTVRSDEPISSVSFTAHDDFSTIIPVITVNPFRYTYTLDPDGSYTWTIEQKDTIMKRSLLEQGGRITDSIKNYEFMTYGLGDAYKIKTNKLTWTSITSPRRSSSFPGATSTGYYAYSSTIDSTVIKILDRKKEQWKNMLVLGDLTGSMAPYSAQLFAWYKMNMLTRPVKHFVFFNDGDMKIAGTKFRAIRVAYTIPKEKHSRH